MVNNDLPPILQHHVAIADGRSGIEAPKTLLAAIEEETAPLLNLANRHVVTSQQFDRDTIVQLCRMAAQYETMPSLHHRPLAGKILITVFNEPSTRTRLSFESAWHRLGGDIMSITDPSTTSSAKGESLEDMGEMFSSYGEVVVLRDNREAAVYDLMKTLRIPVINAGNGVDEHPTQALSDLYAIFKWRPELLDPNLPEAKKISIGVIGTPNRMRTVRSLLTLLSKFPEILKEIVVINHRLDIFDDGMREAFEKAGVLLRVEDRLQRELPKLDVVYINAIAWIGDTYESLTGDLQLDAKSPLKPGSIILHPLARGEELDPSLDATPHNWYFAQARGAVFLRMALLTCLTQRANLVMDVEAPVSSGAPSGPVEKRGSCQF
jgi:aspartate carbamoyltransferase catalytic subunit